MRIICSAWERELENLPNHYKSADFLQVALGIGYLEAARRLQEIITENSYKENGYDVEEIFFIGTAGSYRKNLEIGDIVQVERSRALMLGTIDDKAYLPKKYENYVLKVIPNSPFKKVDAMSSMEITCDDVSAAKIYKDVAKEFLVENMELYGVVHVAHQNKISCTSILGVTNYNNIFAHDEWKNNHEEVSDKLCRAIGQVAI